MAAIQALAREIDRLRDANSRLAVRIERMERGES
jgi:ubiquinone biosynthesis protein UbiJ